MTSLPISNDIPGTPASQRRLRPVSWLGEAVLAALLRRIEYGRLAIDLPDGRAVVHDSGRPGPQARLVLHSWRALWGLISGGDIGFAESHMAGDWSSPDLPDLMEFACANEHVAGSPLPSLGLVRRLRHALNRNTRRGSRRNIAAHYDLGNDFYRQWLDDGMSYSSAIYTSADQSLESAQAAKLDRVLDLLALTGGERVLEIGCGWGGLAEHIVARTEASVTGLTLSRQQLDYATARLASAGLGGRADLRLQDYRDVAGTFDRIVSIEMLEAVGEAYWPVYFATLRDRLRPGGRAVVQVISIAEDQFPHYRTRPDFIQRYVFPGGMLPTVSAMRNEIAAAGLRMSSSEMFGSSYARTVAHWRNRFLRAWPAISALGFDARFKRLWDYYLAYCEAGFRTGRIDVGLYVIERP
ncbi:cyclopropane-fatty-acyl-phospholipid synthase family protein [Xanthobacteraceae bacterium Astr-EGSB]|uniref:class I SAM-dependent methyltransferase n=1 Tax=Astrobacterium formosum TaxID=3069710 RepID=UPI0027B41E2B|nr:cyclopropane-fatty-acyl-phospholipid synthase family protein [Xanthobacteraceae bacterium Astr-EGSB]